MLFKLPKHTFMHYGHVSVRIIAAKNFTQQNPHRLVSLISKYAFKKSTAADPFTRTLINPYTII